MLTRGKATFLSRGCRRRKALFRNSQEENSWYAFKTDRTQTLPCAIKKTQLSSPFPSVTFSVSHLQGLLVLPDFSSSPSPTLSATSSLQLFYGFSVTDLISSPQFPFHFLPFSLQVSLTLTTSSLSASRLSPSCFPPSGIRLRCSLLVRC